MAERGDWTGYYDGQGEREPHELLLQVLASFDREDRTGVAVDLGCGQGIETAELLRRGWEVVAIDATEEGESGASGAGSPTGSASRLRTVVSRMQDVGIPSADLVHASFSLPYCPPDVFPRLWRDLRAAIVGGPVRRGAVRRP